MRFEIRPGVRRLLRFPLRSRAALRRDVDDELASLVASRIEHLIARGMSPDEARAAALRRVGASLDQVRLQLYTTADRRERRMRLSDFLASVAQDIRYAARGLTRRPAFTAVAVLTLAIGVGATTAIFSAVNVLLLRPLPYAQPNQLMRAALVLPAEDGRPSQTIGFAYPMFTAFRDGQRTFSDLAVYAASPLTLTSGDVERVGGEYVSASYLRTLSLAPERGRDFDRALDAHGGAPHQAIVSDALWRSRFDADPSISARRSRSTARRGRSSASPRATFAACPARRTSSFRSRASPRARLARNRISTLSSHAARPASRRRRPPRR